MEQHSCLPLYLIIAFNKIKSRGLSISKATTAKHPLHRGFDGEMLYCEPLSLLLIISIRVSYDQCIHVTSDQEELKLVVPR